MSSTAREGREPGRPLLLWCWWGVCAWLLRQLARVLYRFRIEGHQNVPRQGPVIFICNHQSFLDPVFDGAAVLPRQFTPMARETLFTAFKPFGWLIRSFGAVPLARGNADAAAIRIALGELAGGRCILLYPEGTRTPDGAMRPFQRGFLLLQRRAAVDVVPMGLDGAFEVWSRNDRRPRFRGRVRVAIGPAIRAATLAGLPPDRALRMCEEAVDRLRLQARASNRAASDGRWPPPGRGDDPLHAVKEPEAGVAAT